MSIIDTQKLITLVYDRPAIWDKSHKFYCNRNVIDNCWKKISLEMKEDEYRLRKRWKYLRDQFTVEYGKISPGLSGDDAIAVYPRWPYFKRLLFLKDVIKPKPRTSTGNTGNQPQSSPSPEPSSVHKDHEYTEIQSTHDIEFIPLTSPMNLEDTECTESTAFPTSLNSGIRKSISEKTLDTESQTLHSIFQYFQGKQTSEQHRQQEEKEDDIVLFFKSLIPHVRKIPQHMQLSFRNRIQDVVEEFAYRLHSRHTNPVHSSVSNCANLLDNSQHSEQEADQDNKTIVAQWIAENQQSSAS